MSKEEIRWRLKEQPSTEGLRDLVKDGLLTKDEARQILFSTETKEDADVASLNAEIKFLRELVKTLSTSTGTSTVFYPRYYERYPWTTYYTTTTSGSTAYTLTAGNSWGTSA